MQLQGRGMLVTGASRGLGAELLRQAVGRGARVVGVARGRAELEKLVNELRAEGGEAHALAFDLGDKHAIHQLAGAAAALIGDVDVLVHNAGALGPTPLRLLLDTECEDLEQVLAVNLLGPFRLSKLIAGSMALRKTGVIVHISSDASVSAYPRWGAYSISKAALDHLSRLWGAELGEHGVRSIAIDPGEMDTEMHALAIPDADPSTLARPADVARKILDAIERAEELELGARLEAGSLA